jgi:DNA-binding transcriptional LysR family regulator
LDIRFLETLLAVVERGSIAAAARQQNLTPTAVSQRLRVLEREFGQPLMLRGAHSIRPTAACLGLMPQAAALIADAKKLVAQADPDALSGSFRLGVISTAMTDHVPAIVRHMAAEAPRAELAIIPGASAELYDRLLSGELDAAIIVAPAFQPPKRLAMQEIDAQPPILINARSSHRPALDLLRVEPLLVYDRHSWGGRITWSWIEDHGPHGKVLCELDSLETIAALVSEGIGIAVVPDWPGLAAKHPQLLRMSLDDAGRYTRRTVVMAERASFGSPLFRCAIASLGRARDSTT